SWQKVDKNGNEIEEEDDITQGNSNVDPDSGENTGGDNGGDDNGGGGGVTPPGGNSGNDD
ncbi:MAG: hypothetical protein J6P67_00845, partial [Bacteroidaceae bacterium]|nr:hypothetical protein [Bacteroidaceae bacterium]